jgi:hypothetical protein
MFEALDLKEGRPAREIEQLFQVAVGIKNMKAFFRASALDGEADAKGEKIDATDGGHIEGPGTPTSDSVPLWGSRKEYMVNAAAVESVGVPFMHRLNQLGRKALGWFGLAAGGLAGGGNVSAQSAELTPGQHDIADDGAGGAIIDGVDYPRGSAILLVQQGIAASLKPQQPQQKSGKHHSPFTNTDEDKQAAQNASDAYEKWLADTTPPDSGSIVSGGTGYAKGGLIAPSFAERISAMGIGTINIPHFAMGGMMDHFDPVSSEAMESISGPASGPGPLHPVTLNLPGGESIDGFHAEPSALKQLSRAANQAKRFSTGPKPSWYGGGGSK